MSKTIFECFYPCPVILRTISNFLDFEVVVHSLDFLPFLIALLDFVGHVCELLSPLLILVLSILESTLAFSQLLQDPIAGSLLLGNLDLASFSFGKPDFIFCIINFSLTILCFSNLAGFNLRRDLPLTSLSLSASTVLLRLFDPSLAILESFLASLFFTILTSLLSRFDPLQTSLFLGVPTVCFRIYDFLLVIHYLSFILFHLSLENLDSSLASLLHLAPASIFREFDASLTVLLCGTLAVPACFIYLFLTRLPFSLEL